MATEEELKALIDSMPPVKRRNSQRTVLIEGLIEALRKSCEQRYKNLPAAEKRRLERKKRLEERKRKEKRELAALQRVVPRFENFLMERLIEKCVTHEYSVCGAPIKVISWKTDLSVYKIKEIIQRLELKQAPTPYSSNCSYKLIREWAKRYPKGGTSIAEKRLLNLLRKHFPRQWRYVGDWKIVIGNKCPDFINKHQKLVIELFGEWYHLYLPKRINPELTREHAEAERIAHFKRYGYRTLVIWASELDNERKVAQKIKTFMEDSHVARTAD